MHWCLQTKLGYFIDIPITCVSLKRGVEYELSPIFWPLQNQILFSGGLSYVGTWGTSFSLPQAYQENPLDIGLDIFPLFVFVCR